MSKQEDRYIIVKRDGEKVQFVRHESHQHFWTSVRTDAMEYTRTDVAEGIAKKMGGYLQVI